MEKWKIFRFIGKFSDLSENFPQLKIFQFIKFGKKIFRFFQIGKFSTFCKCSNLSDFSGKISTFSIRSENWHTYKPGRIKISDFSKSWKSGKFSDLSENFPQLQILQFIKFLKKISRFFQIGKFSTFCKYSNSSDSIGKISTFSIRSENWHTYRYAGVSLLVFLSLTVTIKNFLFLDQPR